MKKIKIYLLAGLTAYFLSGSAEAFLPPCPVLPPCPDIDAGTDVQEILSQVQTQAQNIQAQATAYMQQINQQAKAMLDSYMGKAKDFVGGIYKNARKKALAGVKELKKSKIAKDTDPISVKEAMYPLFFQYPVDCNDKTKPENINVCQGYKSKAKEFHQDKVVEIYTLSRQMEVDIEKLEQSVKDIDEKTQEGNDDTLTAWTNVYNTYQTLTSILKLIQELEALRLQYVAAQAIGSEMVAPSIPVSNDKKASNEYFMADKIKIASVFQNKTTIQFAQLADDEDEEKVSYARSVNFVETPADLKDPYADNRENLELLAKITEANDYLKEALEMHNYILNLPSYKATYKNYQKAQRVHEASIGALKRSEQCAIRYYGEMYEDPAKMWNGNLSENNITNYDLRKGISGWAVKAFTLAKAGDAGVTVSAEDFEEADYDETANPNDLSNLEAMTKSNVPSEGENFKDAKKKAQVDSELKESRRIAWNIGAEAARLLAEDQLTNGKNGSWGKAKLLYNVWKDTQSYYNQYIEGKYDSIAKSLDAFNTNELALNIASNLVDILSSDEEKYDNRNSLRNLKEKLQKDRQEAVSDVDNLVAEKKQKITALYEAKEAKVKELEKRENDLVKQINQKQANIDKETLKLQSLKDEKLKAEQNIIANEQIVETIYEHELLVPNTKVFETTTEEYKKDLNASFIEKQSYNIYHGFYENHNLVANAQLTTLKVQNDNVVEKKETTVAASEKIVAVNSKNDLAKELALSTSDKVVSDMSANKIEVTDKALSASQALKSNDIQDLSALKTNVETAEVPALKTLQTGIPSAEENAAVIKEVAPVAEAVSSPVAISAGVSPVSVNANTNVASKATTGGTINSIKSSAVNTTAVSKITSSVKSDKVNAVNPLISAAPTATTSVQSNNTGFRTTPNVSVKTEVEQRENLSDAVKLKINDPQEAEKNIITEDLRTYKKVIVTEKEVKEEDPARLLLAEQDLKEAREEVLRLTTEIPSQEQAIDNLKNKLQEDKEALEAIKEQKENINKDYVNQTRETTTLYDTKIAQAEKAYASALAKYNNIDLAQYYKTIAGGNGVKYLSGLSEILTDANMLVNDTKGAVKEIIREAVEQMGEINEKMYTREITPEEHQKMIVAKHSQLIEHLKNLNNQDLVSFSEGIEKYSSYSGIMSLLKGIYSAYITSDACQQDVCKVPDKECFISNNGKRRDFLAPAKVPDSPLPSVRDVVFFDYTDYDSIPQGDKGQLTREGLLSTMTYIPDIWKRILTSPAYFERDIDLSVVIKPSEAKMANAGKYPCWYGENKEYLVTSYDESRHNTGYVIYYQPKSVMGSDTDSIKKKKELLEKNYQQCTGFELSVSGGGATIYNPANDVKGSGKLKAFSSFKPAETESELGYLFNYDNGLKYNTLAHNVFKSLSDGNKNKNSDGKIEEILDNDISMEKTQLGEFLKAVDYEQESRQNVEEAKVSLDETKEELRELFSRLNFAMANNFDLTRDSDYNSARSSLLNYRNKMIANAKSTVSPLQGNDNEVIKERMDSINRLIGVLEKDSEVLVSLGDDTENNSKLDEEIKAQKANKEVIARQEIEEEKSFEQQLKFIEDPYCAQMVDNL